MMYDHRAIRRHVRNRDKRRFVMAYCAMFIMAGFLLSFFSALMAAGGHK